MPLGSIASKNASLDNDYGTTRGPNAAASHEVALYAGDPLNGGVELSGGGYARVTVLAAQWPAAADGIKEVTVTFPTPTAEWDEATHHALIAGADVWDVGRFSTPLRVSGPGPQPVVGIRVFY